MSYPNKLDFGGARVVAGVAWIGSSIGMKRERHFTYNPEKRKNKESNTVFSPFIGVDTR
jgi:hypothetical protein